MRTILPSLAVLLALPLAALTACGDDEAPSVLAPTASGAGAGTAGSSVGGSGAGSGSTFSAGVGAGDSTGSSTGGNQPCMNELTGVVRDFRDSHPDFEATLGTEKGIVEELIGADQKPVYAGGPTDTVESQESFDQWYRDVDGVNTPIPLAIPLSETAPGIYGFDSDAFFPIDDQGFGNEGRPHNYHFTYEIHAEFEYAGGEVFTFRGDDDLFTFINGRLAIDLGGVHGPQEATIDLDASAADLEITVGNVYTLDFFFAERHTTQSNFRIDTTIPCFNEVPIPE